MANPVKFSDKLTDSLNDITRMINENKQMIDSIQEVALELTSVFGTLHTLTLKYATMANSILDTLLPILSKIPLISPKIVHIATDMEKLTQKIIDSSVQTSKVIIDVEDGLKNGDVSKLKGHAGEIKKLTSSLKAVIPNLK